MAKDTQIIVRVPGEFQLLLTEYMLLLKDRGVHISKSEAIIQLAVNNLRVIVEELREASSNG